MEDRDFFDHLYQQWAKTYGAENMYWMTEEATDGVDTLWEVYAVDKNQEKHFIATFQGEEDADFIAAVHGCLPDLVRRMHEALDEADRLDIMRDEQAVLAAELALEADDLQATRDSLECRIMELEMELAGINLIRSEN